MNIDLDKLQRRLKLRMAAIPLVIITLDLVVIPLVVSTIMKGKPFQFQALCDTSTTSVTKRFGYLVGCRKTRIEKIKEPQPENESSNL